MQFNGVGVGMRVRLRNHVILLRSSLRCLTTKEYQCYSLVCIATFKAYGIYLKIKTHISLRSILNTLSGKVIPPIFQRKNTGRLSLATSPALVFRYAEGLQNQPASKRRTKQKNSRRLILIGSTIISLTLKVILNPNGVF